MAGERWRTLDLLRFDLGGGQHLVYSRATRAARVLNAAPAALLSRCRTFRTLHEHAAAYASSQADDLAEGPLADLWDRLFPWKLTRAVNPFGRPQRVSISRIDVVQHELEALTRDGLLVDEGSLKAGCLNAQPLPSSEPTSLRTISVLTAGRVASLERCLRSYLDNARQHGRRVRVVVMDDSRTPAIGEATRQMLVAVGGELDAEIGYAGAGEKRAFGRALAADGTIPPDVIGFALSDPEGCGRSTGANHNAQLLHLAGEAFLTVDDDTTARLVRIPGADDSLELAVDHEPHLTWFFPDRASALDAMAFQRKDAIGIHEAFVGQSVADSVRGLNDPARLLVDHLGPPMLRHVEDGRGRILATQTGLVGDAGNGNPPALGLFGIESWSRLVATERAYRSAMRSREVVRGMARATISANPFFSTGPAVALDNRELLPPFFPVQRNTDGIFGLCLRTCFEAGFIAHLPWALEHAPGEVRLIGPDMLIAVARQLMLHDVVLACIHSASVGGGTPDARHRIRTLGEHLRALGAVDAREFTEFLRPWIWRLRAVGIARLEQDLQRHGMRPTYWTADVRLYLDTLRVALAGDAYLVPQDLPAGLSEGATGALMRRLIRRFGDLLCWWPAMVERARELRDGGRPLAVRL